MERLTKKLSDGNFTCECGLNYFEYGDGHLEIFNKLGHLEDLEQELGIPLEVLFKALEDGIWTYDYDKKITRTDSVELGLGINGWYLTNMSYIAWIKDYGKTWWLEEPKEKVSD